MKSCCVLITGLIVFVAGCIDPYDPSLQLSATLVVVNAMITDQNSAQTITLSRSRSSADSTSTTPIAKAQVELLVDGNPLPLQEDNAQPGTYLLPSGLLVQVAHTYQLRFRTAQGTTYQSSIEVMKPVAPILHAYDQPHNGMVVVGDTVAPASDIFVDYQDPPNQSDFYFWRWRNYEVQQYCASCRQGRYVLRDIGPVGSGPLEVLGCIVDTTIRSYVTYDYPCRSQCWDIFYNTDYNLFSDVYTNGRLQVGHRVATIPAYQASPGLLVIEQLSLSANAYRYYKLFVDQVQNTGTLADSPPAPISGNIKNLTNASENVVGYFCVSSVAEYRYKLSRQKLNLVHYVGLFRAETKRAPRREEDRNNSIFGAPFPSALCLPSRTRTDQVPPGW